MLCWIRGCLWKTFGNGCPLSQVSSHKAQSSRAQSYSLYKLRRLGHIRWRGHLQGIWGCPGAHTPQEPAQLPAVRRSSCLGAAGMCHRRVLLAGGCSELCRTARAVEIAGLARSEMLGTDLSSCCSPLYLPVEHSSFPGVATALLMQKETDLPAL